MAYRHGSRCHCQWCRGWNNAKARWAADNEAHAAQIDEDVEAAQLDRINETGEQK
jgi:hypothetical protein